ncbi:4,5-DOPA dioxygenase extradiol-like [Chrysoperla carnea]|uniref:4,5-DOPA dioxygenase extradiol-like n=1 Tax=Chrysoperla carnea TaxID=189513 RepID=UPI001D05F9CF|nr:4,5-DOPA dioxygenase extradiol-like [Chrysoperla carnea]
MIANIFIVLVLICYSKTEESSKTPVFFISHGGPNFMYMKDFGGYKAVEKIGNEIKNFPNLKGIIVISAHWQSNLDEIYVNTAEHTELLYDFPSPEIWPAYMFEEQYANVGSKEISSKIMQSLKDANIKTVPKSRGLDHGAWVPFKIAFPSDKVSLSVPIVQISLYTNEDPNLHFNVGRALSPLRNEGIVIIGSGMSVHNVNEHDLADNEIAKYVVPFDNAIVDAMTKNKGEARRIALNELVERSDIRNAHPTFEHFFPLFVAAGATYDDTCELLFTSYVASFAWGQFRCSVD